MESNEGSRFQDRNSWQNIHDHFYTNSQLSDSIVEAQDNENRNVNTSGIENDLNMNDRYDRSIHSDIISSGMKLDSSIKDSLSQACGEMSSQSISDSDHNFDTLGNKEGFYLGFRTMNPPFITLNPYFPILISNHHNCSTIESCLLFPNLPYTYHYDFEDNIIMRKKISNSIVNIDKNRNVNRDENRIDRELSEDELKQCLEEFDSKSKFESGIFMEWNDIFSNDLLFNRWIHAIFRSLIFEENSIFHSLNLLIISLENGEILIIRIYFKNYQMKSCIRDNGLRYELLARINAKLCGELSLFHGTGEKDLDRIFIVISTGYNLFQLTLKLSELVRKTFSHVNIEQFAFSSQSYLNNNSMSSTVKPYIWQISSQNHFSSSYLYILYSNIGTQINQVDIYEFSPNRNQSVFKFLATCNRMHQNIHICSSIIPIPCYGKEPLDSSCKILELQPKFISIQGNDFEIFQFTPAQEFKFVRIYSTSPSSDEDFGGRISISEYDGSSGIFQLLLNGTLTYFCLQRMQIIFTWPNFGQYDAIKILDSSPHISDSDKSGTHVVFAIDSEGIDLWLIDVLKCSCKILTEDVVLDPILDIAVKDSSNSEFIACTASDVVNLSSGLNSYQIFVSEATFDSVNGLWVLHISKLEIDRFIVLSFSNSTQIFVIEDQRLEELHHSAFQTNSQTIDVLNISEDNYLQATNTSLRVISFQLKQLTGELLSSTYIGAISVCSLSQNRSIIVLDSNDIYLYDWKSKKNCFQRKFLFKSSTDVSSVCHSEDRNIIILGTRSQHIKIYNFEGIQTNQLQILSSSIDDILAIPNSIVIYSSENDETKIAVGLRNGWLNLYAINSAVEIEKSIQVGDSPVSIIQQRNHPQLLVNCEKLYVLNLQEQSLYPTDLCDQLYAAHISLPGYNPAILLVNSYDELEIRLLDTSKHLISKSLLDLDLGQVNGVKVKYSQMLDAHFILCKRNSGFEPIFHLFLLVNRKMQNLGFKTSVTPYCMALHEHFNNYVYNGYVALGFENGELRLLQILPMLSTRYISKKSQKYDCKHLSILQLKGRVYCCEFASRDVLIASCEEFIHVIAIDKNYQLKTISHNSVRNFVHSIVIERTTSASTLVMVSDRDDSIYYFSFNNYLLTFIQSDIVSRYSNSASLLAPFYSEDQTRQSVVALDRLGKIFVNSYDEHSNKAKLQLEFHLNQTSNSLVSVRSGQRNILIVGTLVGSLHSAISLKYEEFDLLNKLETGLRSLLQSSRPKNVNSVDFDFLQQYLSWSPSMKQKLFTSLNILPDLQEGFDKKIMSTLQIFQIKDFAL